MTAPGQRWGVFVRDPRDSPDWAERFRWDGNDLVPLPDQAAAEARADETRRMHPEWEVEARQTSDPLPGTFREAVVTAPAEPGGYVDPRPLTDQERRDFLAELAEAIAAASILHTTVRKGDAGLWQRGYVDAELAAVRRHLNQARQVLLNQARRENLAASDALLRSRP